MNNEQKVSELRELFRQRDEIDAQIANILNGSQSRVEKKPERKIVEKIWGKEAAKKRRSGQWSAKFDRCQSADCQTPNAPHSAKGYCKRCYMEVFRNSQQVSSDTPSKRKYTKRDDKNIKTDKSLKNYVCNDCGAQFSSTLPKIDAVCPFCDSIHIRFDL